MQTIDELVKRMGSSNGPVRSFAAIDDEEELSGKETPKTEEPKKGREKEPETLPDKEKMPETPANLSVPTYLMNLPLTISVDNPNNAWMKEMKEGERKLNMDKALRQWMDLYNFIAANAIVYLLPPGGDYQDQIYVANLGIALPHMKKPTIVLSKFKSKPRQGEEDIGKDFFEIWNKYHLDKYDIKMAPLYWEGEAELKYLHDNIYAGGYGQRTDPKVYDWFEKEFDMKIVRCEMTDEKLYHWDCSCFPLTKDKTIICTEVLKPGEVKQLEKVTEVIPITKEEAHDGITNCVRVRNMVLMASDLKALKETSEEYKHERASVERLQEICVDEGLCPIIFNLSELEKSGAALSCTCMHMNTISRERSMVEA